MLRASLWCAEDRRGVGRSGGSPKSTTRRRGESVLADDGKKKFDSGTVFANQRMSMVRSMRWVVVLPPEAMGERQCVCVGLLVGGGVGLRQREAETRAVGQSGRWLMRAHGAVEVSVAVA